jgi:hypothetical protein
MANMIVQYKRKGKATTKKGKRIKKGIMVAFPDAETGIVRFGFSLCCFRQKELPVDEFDLKFGTNLAVDRAMTDDRPLHIPTSMTKDFTNFVDRCKKYYKQIDPNNPSHQNIVYTPEQPIPTPVAA